MAELPKVEALNSIQGLNDFTAYFKKTDDKSDLRRFFLFVKHSINYRGKFKMKNKSGGGTTTDFIVLIMFITVSAFALYILTQDNELKAQYQMQTRQDKSAQSTTNPDKVGIILPSGGKKKQNTDKYTRRLEFELEAMRKQIKLYEQEKQQIQVEKYPSHRVKIAEKESENIGNDKTVLKLFSEKELLLDEKDRQLRKKEEELKNKGRELLQKEEGLKKYEEKLKETK